MTAGAQVTIPLSARTRFGLPPTLQAPCLAALLLGSSTLALVFPPSLSAQSLGGSQTLPGAQERQLFGTGSSTGGGLGSGSSGLDINNPIDLINRIRRSTALDDATPPSSAVDQALRELEKPAAPAKPVSQAPVTPSAPLRPIP